MIRLIARTCLSFLANVVGLLVATLVLDNFNINGISFIAAAVIFTLATVILGPLVTKIAFTNAPYLMGGIALVTILVGLVVTDIFSDGLSIEGFFTWFSATFIIWVFSLIANVLLPLVLFKKVLTEAKESKN